MTAAGVELWLIRHGETDWSASGKHTSRTEVPLTARGRQRAQVLGNYLVGIPFSAVFRSPMGRARETCEIAGFGSRAIVDDDLKEWDYGIYEGRTTPEIQKEIPGWSVWKDPIVGGETIEQVGKRADAMIVRALEAVAANVSAGVIPSRVALFGHAHILRVLAAQWLQLPPVDGRLFALGTGTVSVLGWERDGRVILRWNRSFEE
jgi:probable phosphoglycerate mutase